MQVIGFIMQGLATLLVVLYLVTLINNANAQNGTDAKNLRQQLFVTNGYDKKIRPRFNQTEVINVNVSFSLLSIMDLSETENTLTTTGFLHISWYDDYLSWNDSDYGGLYYYQYPQTDVWRPDVTLKNTVSGYKQLGDDALNVEAYNDGNIMWYPFEVFQSSCSVDVHYFPFDIQKCTLKFQAWSYTDTEVVMQNDGGVDYYYYEASPTWEVVDAETTTQMEAAVSSISFTLHLRRKPEFFILSVVLPISMLAVLNIFVFVLPCDSGEKASYAMTVFLAFAVFLTIISSSFPESSDTVAIFSVLLIILTLESTVITLIALVMIRLNSFDDTNTPVPNFLQVFIRVTTLKACFGNKKRNSTFPEKMKKDPEIVSVNGYMGADKESVGDSSEASQTDYTWKEAINELDRICFVFFQLVFILSFSACMIMEMSKSDCGQRISRTAGTFVPPGQDLRCSLYVRNSF